MNKCYLNLWNSEDGRTRVTGVKGLADIELENALRTPCIKIAKFCSNTWLVRVAFKVFKNGTNPASFFFF